MSLYLSKSLNLMQSSQLAKIDNSADVTTLPCSGPLTLYKVDAMQTPSPPNSANLFLTVLALLQTPGSGPECPSSRLSL